MSCAGLLRTAAACLLLAACSPLLRADQGCGVGKDLVVQALEHLPADSSHDQLVDADALLKRAAEVCDGMGEAWYYRALVERKLGHGNVADYAMRQAKMFPSKAMADGLDPFVLSAPAQGPPPGPIRQKWALLLGVSHFEDKTIPSLKYGTDDAQAFHDVLVDPKYGKMAADHVRLLTDAAATTEGLREGLNWLARVAQPDDLVMVYVASHGSERALDTAGANYIITYDTKLGENQDPDKLYATAYPIVDLSQAIATRVHARRVAIFIDTCYSGEAAESAAALAGGLKPASISAQTLAQTTQGTGRVVITASKPDQESLESLQLHHGYFTYYLVEAMKELGGDASTNSVFQFVSKHVSEKVAADYSSQGGKYQQTPVMSRSTDATDFALESAPAAVAATLPAMRLAPYPLDWRAASIADRKGGAGE